MIRKFLVLTFLFFVPVIYIPYLLQGYIIKANFVNILVISMLLSLCVVITPFIIQFLTIKSNIIIKIILVSLLMYGGLYLLTTFSSILQITSGGIDPSLVSGTPYLHFLSQSVGAYINIAITSLLMAIWGIMWNLLL